MLLTGIRRGSLRFTFSPVQEALRALHVLADARHHAEQMTWVRSTRRRLTAALKAEIKRFGPLLCPAPEIFPDLLPSPSTSSFADELALLAAGRDHLRNAMVRRMIGKPLLSQAEIEAASQAGALKRLARAASLRDPHSAPLYDAFVKSPAAVLRDLCALLEAFVARCGAGQWAEFEARALDDACAREQLLERFGVAGMLRTLTREIRVSGDRRSASLGYGGEESSNVRLEVKPSATLTLTPSYFIWPHASFLVLRRDALDVRIAYPLASPSSIRVPSRSWEPAAKRFAALADPTRLHMLELLRDRNLSTREFAGLLGLSEGGVSRHLSILRDAKLVTSVRDGYFVLYKRAALGFTELLGLVERFGETAAP